MYYISDKMFPLKKKSCLIESFEKNRSFKEVVCAKAAKKYQKARENKKKQKTKKSFKLLT